MSCKECGKWLLYGDRPMCDIKHCPCKPKKDILVECDMCTTLFMVSKEDEDIRCPQCNAFVG